MVDLSEKGSESEDMNNKSPDAVSSAESQVNEPKKTCADCGTTKTPLWRGGPAGPKSLCNACGIRSRKKRRAILGLNKGSADDRKAKRSSNPSHNNGGGNGNNKLGDSLKRRLFALGREVLLQRSTVEKQRRKLGEEEQAAVLLMALSYGYVYA
ncbi:hypothetical protein PVL29_005537 [Vitis rotundifolia]|uniref:GATA-type domain-containing protein n=2 Tax=Vitis rotundifolia TaxID=103349 RepID=A0AA39DWP9_VITRO|nr:hypothetical protein PVL29_005537 [Vitis rotundifolia]